MKRLSEIWRKVDTLLLRLVITKVYSCTQLSNWYCRWCGAKWNERCKEGCV